MEVTNQTAIVDAAVSQYTYNLNGTDNGYKNDSSASTFDSLLNAFIKTCRNTSEQKK